MEEKRHREPDYDYSINQVGWSYVELRIYQRKKFLFIKYWSNIYTYMNHRRYRLWDIEDYKDSDCLAFSGRQVNISNHKTAEEFFDEAFNSYYKDLIYS